MNTLDQQKLLVLLHQIDITITELESKETLSGEKYVSEVLEKYRAARTSIANNDVHKNRKSIDRLLSCARGYLETSSNYSQQFLNEMDKTEQLISAL